MRNRAPQGTNLHTHRRNHLPKKPVQAEVRAMRRGGRKLTREQIQASNPLRGELVIFRRLDHWNDKEVVVATLREADQVTYVLPPMEQVRITRLQGIDMILLGLESRQLRKQEVLDLQAWWVRLLPTTTSSIAERDARTTLTNRRPQ